MSVELFVILMLICLVGQSVRFFRKHIVIESVNENYIIIAEGKERNYVIQQKEDFSWECLDTETGGYFTGLELKPMLEKAKDYRKFCKRKEEIIK